MSWKFQNAWARVTSESMLAKVLLVALLMAVYLGGWRLLFADTTPLQWALLYMAIHVGYSSGLVWLYASLKVRYGVGWASLLIPLLTTTSTLGLVLWLVWRPEEAIKRQRDRS
jgi:hypothetical protein